MVYVTVMMQEPLVEQLTAVAEATGRTRSGLIRWLCQEAMRDRQERRQEQQGQPAPGAAQAA